MYASLEARRQYGRVWIAARRAQFFSDKFCKNCQATTNLELHHIKPEEKVTNCIWSWTESRRLVEIAKCEVLCNACHKIVTAAAVQAKHGCIGRYKRGCRCTLCKAVKSEENKKRKPRRIV